VGLQPPTVGNPHRVPPQPIQQFVIMDEEEKEKREEEEEKREKERRRKKKDGKKRGRRRSIGPYWLLLQTKIKEK
jgi:hypothetical protein